MIMSTNSVDLTLDLLSRIGPAAARQSHKLAQLLLSESAVDFVKPDRCLDLREFLEVYLGHHPACQFPPPAHHTEAHDLHFADDFTLAIEWFEMEVQSTPDQPTQKLIDGQHLLTAAWFLAICMIPYQLTSLRSRMLESPTCHNFRSAMSAVANVQMARSYLFANEFQLASELLERALECSPQISNLDEVQLIQASLLFYQARFEEASASFDELLDSTSLTSSEINGFRSLHLFSLILSPPSHFRSSHLNQMMSESPDYNSFSLIDLATGIGQERPIPTSMITENCLPKPLQDGGHLARAIAAHNLWVQSPNKSAQAETHRYDASAHRSPAYSSPFTHHMPVGFPIHPSPHAVHPTQSQARPSSPCLLAYQSDHLSAPDHLRTEMTVERDTSPISAVSKERVLAPKVASRINAPNDQRAIKRPEQRSDLEGSTSTAKRVRIAATSTRPGPLLSDDHDSHHVDDVESDESLSSMRSTHSRKKSRPYCHLTEGSSSWDITVMEPPKPSRPLIKLVVPDRTREQSTIRTRDPSCATSRRSANRHSADFTKTHHYSYTDDVTRKDEGPSLKRSILNLRESRRHRLSSAEPSSEDVPISRQKHSHATKDESLVDILQRGPELINELRSVPALSEEKVAQTFASLSAERHKMTAARSGKNNDATSYTLTLRKYRSWCEETRIPPLPITLVKAILWADLGLRLRGFASHMIRCRIPEIEWARRRTCANFDDPDCKQPFWPHPIWQEFLDDSRFPLTYETAGRAVRRLAVKPSHRVVPPLSVDKNQGRQGNSSSRSPELVRIQKARERERQEQESTVRRRRRRVVEESDEDEEELEEMEKTSEDEDEESRSESTARDPSPQQTRHFFLSGQVWEEPLRKIKFEELTSPGQVRAHKQLILNCLRWESKGTLIDTEKFLKAFWEYKTDEGKSPFEKVGTGVREENRRILSRYMTYCEDQNFLGLPMTKLKVLTFFIDHQSQHSSSTTRNYLRSLGYTTPICKRLVEDDKDFDSVKEMEGLRFTKVWGAWLVERERKEVQL